MLEENRCTIGDIDFSFGKGPDNGPPLLLLHGLTFRWQLFDSLFPSLEPDWQLYALDFRGHGNSGRAANCDYRFDSFVQDTKAFIESEIGKPAVLIGYSLGGAVGLKAAGQLKDLVRALVVIDNFLFWDSLQAVRADPAIKTLFTSVQALVRRNNSTTALVASISDINLPLPEPGRTIRVGDVYDRDFMNRWAASVARIDPEVIDVLFGDVTPEVFDGDALLRAVVCPLLLLQGNPALGALLSDTDVQRARAIQPLTQHARFDHLGHMMHMQDSRAVSAAIGDFLKGIPV
jgi:pimeloyl-ACP methyl ester carboxylesterase